MSDEPSPEEPVDDAIPPVDEASMDEPPAQEADGEDVPSEEAVEDEEVVEEPRDPLEVALERAEFAEKEIAYKEAEIQNVRKRLMAEKADAIQFGGMGLARRMLTVLGDVDRALTGLEEDDESPVAQGLRLLRNKMWHELQADGVSRIEAKGETFDPSKMEAITTIPPSEAYPNGSVVDVLEEGYTYKSKVLLVARVVVASE